MRLEDLPPDMQRQVLAKAGKPKAIRDRRQAPAGRTSGRCHDCAEVFATYPAWERHADASDHHRWDLDTATA